MTNQTENIYHAAKSIKTKTPAYDDLISFYLDVFIAQEKSRQTLQTSPMHVPEDILEIKKKAAFPMVSPSEFSANDSSARLLDSICDIIMRRPSEMSGDAKIISDAICEKKLNPDRLFQALFKEDESFFQQAANDMGIKKKTLAFVCYLSLAPSISASSDQLSSSCGASHEIWEKGICPICGGPPSLSAHKENGARFLICGFCSHEWPFPRRCCPFCENRDSETLHYFFQNDEDGYRIDVCDMCKRYIKSVDTQKIDHFFYPPLEQVATLHLDLTAKKKGYKNETAPMEMP